MTISSSGSDEFSGITDADGNISFTGLDNSLTYTCTAYSDSNGDKDGYNASKTSKPGSTVQLTVHGHF